MSAFVEKWYPYAAGVLVAVLWYWWDLTPPKTAPALLSAIISVSSIAVGFLAAAQAIILSLDDARVIRQLRELGGYKILLRYLNEAIILSFALACVSAVAMLRDFETRHWHDIAEALWALLVAASVCSYYRVLRVFFKILSAPR